MAFLLELLLAYQKSVNLYILYLPMNMFLPLTWFQRVEFRVIQWRCQRPPLSSMELTSSWRRQIWTYIRYHVYRRQVCCEGTATHNTLVPCWTGGTRSKDMKKLRILKEIVSKAREHLTQKSQCRNSVLGQNESSSSGPEVWEGLSSLPVGMLGYTELWSLQIHVFNY